MCPVNSQNDEKLDYAFSLANTCAVAHSTRRNFCLQAVDVQQFIWCQIAMCPLASGLYRYNIPSNTNETTMAANASQWFADQRQYSHHN